MNFFNKRQSFDLIRFLYLNIGPVAGGLQPSGILSVILTQSSFLLLKTTLELDCPMTLAQAKNYIDHVDRTILTIAVFEGVQ